MESTKGSLYRQHHQRHSLNLFCEHIALMSQIELLSIEETLKDEFWIMSMHEELNQFKWNDFWELIPYSKNINIIDTKWVFRNKLDEHGLITRNKARLVTKGYDQQEGINFGETYAMVAR